MRIVIPIAPVYAHVKNYAPPKDPLSDIKISIDNLWRVPMAQGVEFCLVKSVLNACLNLVIFKERTEFT